MDTLTIDVDTRALFDALDALGDAAEELVHEAARATAHRVAESARGRVRRATGQMAAAITVDEAPKPLGGFRVYVGSMQGRADNMAQWHEFGTRYMSAQPFMFNSARLEEGAHVQRVREALARAGREQGFGV